MVAFSSGNHAQGVAIAARRLGIPAIIVMPSDAPGVKVEGTRAQGAEIIFYDRRTESREAIAARIAAENGRDRRAELRRSRISSPGRARSGSKSSTSWRSRCHRPPQIVVPCGGGGLPSGIALACPDAEIVIVEPEGWDDMRRSLEARRDRPGRPGCAADAVRRAADPARVADHLRHPARARRRSALAVSEDEVEAAVRWAWHEHRAGGRARRRGGARGAARGQGRARAGHGGRAVGREYRPGASRADVGRA